MKSTLPLILIAGLGLTLAGCSDDSPVNPNDPALGTQMETMDAALRAEKERNKADLGPGTPLALSSADLPSMSTAVSANSIPFDPEPGPFLHDAELYCDDCISSEFPIGFNFSFFGNSYSTFRISSNGFIRLGAADLNSGCCSGRPIPSADNLDNLIAAAWTDLYPAGGGEISFETRGRSPNRFLIVSFQDIPWCCETGTSRVTSQIILFEGSNTVEIHTAHQSAGHIYTQGAENANGTTAVFLPGRVASNYELTNDGVRFTTELSNFWTSRAPLPFGRRGHAMSVATGILFAIGGNNSSGATLASVHGYNPATNSWSSKAPMPSARQAGNGAATVNGVVYVAGGKNSSGSLTSTLFAYNASSNTWSTRRPMPVVGGCGGSAALNGKIYVFSGCRLNSSGTQMAAGLLHRYDPATNSWTTLRSAPVAHFQPAVGATGGKIYVAGGNNSSSAPIGRLDVYDPVSDTWTTRAAMPTPRVGAAGAVVAGQFYVMGGRQGSTALSTVQVYDPTSNTWSNRAPMPSPRTALGAGVISNLIYAVGGQNGSTVFTTNARYTP